MKRTTKKLLVRTATMAAALTLTLGAAIWTTHGLPSSVPASTDSMAKQVFVLDAGHGGSC